MEPGTTVMLGATESPGLEFKPMTVARVSGDVIEILLDSNEQWARELGDGDIVYVTMSDNRAHTWVSLRGSLSVSSDPALIDELWNPAAGAFFDDGRDNPGIAALRIAAEHGAYWTSPADASAA
jgi:general stress protein 26